LIAPLAFAQSAVTTVNVRIELGRLANSATMTFFRTGTYDVEVKTSTMLDVIRTRAHALAVSLDDQPFQRP
jgi:hypothetical protein